MSSMAVTTNIVEQTVTVHAPQRHAFDPFTSQFAAWWPLESHHISKVAAQTAIIEPQGGGRWFERGVDGSECDWGRVLVWDPPQHLVLVWQLNAEWQYDPSLHTEVEVTFTAEGREQTRVRLEHRKLEAFGEKMEAVRKAVGSEGGWKGLMETFAKFASKK